MTNTCKNCSKTFEILPSEKNFYETKIKLPLPTWCPTCRVKRRMAWRNDRTFYKRTCDKTGETIISMYPPDSPYPVYHQKNWWAQVSGAWDPMDYGQEYDFNKPFFEQFHELMLKVPRRGMNLVNYENSDYCNYSGDEKNCYLDIAAEANEDCYFNLFTKYSKDCCDCTFAYHSTLCYECINVYNSYDTRYSIYCENTSESWFCYDMKGCMDCLFSFNLRQKQYYIFNKPYSKEEYFDYLKSLRLNTHSGLTAAVNQWKKILESEDLIYRDQYKIKCENASGNDLKNCKNTFFSYNVVNAEDCAYLYDVLDAKDCYDVNYSLYDPEMICEIISTVGFKYAAYNMGGSNNCNNVFYCDLISNSSYLFGCIGLVSKKYCILNKQYTKEEYEKLLPQIMEHMAKTMEWGHFFPAKYSPHGYNETVAQEYIPLTREEAIKQGFNWREESETKKIPQTYKIPDAIEDVDEKIIEEILACETCKKNFRIISQELKFYKRMKLPIPGKCPLCRHISRNELRAKRALHDTRCSNCKKSIQTPLENKDSSKKILCEECYLQGIHT